jgi:hypothetical protein
MIRKFLSAGCFAMLIASCSQSNKLQSQTQNSNKGLKDYYSKYFPIGVAVI